MVILINIILKCTVSYRNDRNLLLLWILVHLDVTAITVMENLKEEISVLNVLNGIEVSDDTGKFELDDIAIYSSIMKSKHEVYY